ncbi:hypothetical protein FBEOM_898 [Fusarium beomiforme]|uniref:Uncharacterized protein n=1 Tax=Fusarium beomiforme TaxID=44412 RepID=A0A9P5AUI0_9HYPO|nr:hypothetical protein FBEOM_898 [Fusarium beomiforme]
MALQVKSERPSCSIIPVRGQGHPTDTIEFWAKRSQLSGLDCGRVPDDDSQDPILKGLDLESLPNLEEFYIVAKKVARDPPTNGIPTGQHIVECWNNGTTNHPPGPDEYHCPSQGLLTFEPPENPLIGMYGYDITEHIRGGFWTGFIYVVETGDIWLLEDTHFDFIARVWIIRPYDKLSAHKPHHHWIRVKNTAHRDPRYTKYSELTWEVVAGRFNKKSYGEIPYTLRV